MTGEIAVTGIPVRRPVLLNLTTNAFKFTAEGMSRSRSPTKWSARSGILAAVPGSGGDANLVRTAGAGQQSGDRRFRFGVIAMICRKLVEGMAPSSNTAQARRTRFSFRLKCCWSPAGRGLRRAAARGSRAGCGVCQRLGHRSHEQASSDAAARRACRSAVGRGERHATPDGDQFSGLEAHREKGQQDAGRYQARVRRNDGTQPAGVAVSPIGAGAAAQREALSRGHLPGASPDGSPGDPNALGIHPDSGQVSRPSSLARSWVTIGGLCGSLCDLRCDEMRRCHEILCRR